MGKRRAKRLVFGENEPFMSDIVLYLIGFFKISVRFLKKNWEIPSSIKIPLWVDINRDASFKDRIFIFLLYIILFLLLLAFCLYYYLHFVLLLLAFRLCYYLYFNYVITCILIFMFLFTVFFFIRSRSHSFLGNRRHSLRAVRGSSPRLPAEGSTDCVRRSGKSGQLFFVYKVRATACS